MINLGNENYVNSEQIVKIMSPNEKNARWLIKEATEANKLINCAKGKKYNCLVILKTNHIFLTSKSKQEVENSLAS